MTTMNTSFIHLLYYFLVDDLIEKGAELHRQICARTSAAQQQTHARCSIKQTAAEAATMQVSKVGRFRPLLVSSPRGFHPRPEFVLRTRS